MNQILTCGGCGKTWSRQAQRGRKPKFCPSCVGSASAGAPVEITDANDETLICQQGNHEWHRAKTRGRKPPFCPEHRISAQPMVEVEGDTLKRPSGLPSIDKVITASVQAILDGPQTELRLKAAYTVDELTNPERGAWREQGDWSLLIETHKRLIRECDAATQKYVVAIVEDENDEIATTTNQEGV